MLFSRPSYLPLVKFQASALDALDALADIDSTMSVGVGVFGPAAAYALVWELGSRRLNQPGPKTQWGINRNGDRVILTKQAPEGYVGIHKDEMQSIFDDAVDNVQFIIGDLTRSKLNLEVELDNAAQKIARLISDSAPVDSGDLRSQIQSISTDESEYLDTQDEGVLFI